MRLSRLDVDGLRSLREVRVAPCPGFNLVTGPNGSGKTSLLEAIYLLGHGRSFRSRHAREVVRNGGDGLALFAEVAADAGEEAERHRVGLEWQRSGAQRIRLDGAAARASSELARLLPMMVVNADGQRVLGDGARERRALMDWLLFHVEQGYHGLLREYRRALLQRNAGLKRSSPAELSVWTEALADAGERLNRMRESRLPALLESVAERVGNLVGIEVECRFSRGWPGDGSLAAALESAVAADRQREYTRVGPHRADLVLRVDGRPAHRMLSRGEGKLLVYALALSQVVEVSSATGRMPLLLLDDLPAELDEANRRRFLQHLAAVDGLQVFITAVGDMDAGTELPGDAPLALFHVEQGRVEPVVQ